MAESRVAERRLLASSLWVNTLLTMAGGFLDGFTYFGHGHVFANAMTGNIIILGNSLITSDWSGAAHRFYPLVAFFIGISFSQFTHLYAKWQKTEFDPYIRILLLESTVLLLCGWYPMRWNDTLLIMGIAFVASAQVQTFRDVRGRSYFSTFTTGNLRTLCEAAFSWFFEKRNAQVAQEVRSFALICTVFLIGTILGGLSFRYVGNHALWFTAVLLLLALYRLQRGRAGMKTSLGKGGL